MLFSIIIPTYNRAAILKETLSSVISQSYSDYEIIIVDDGSTDNTAEVVRQIESDKIYYYYKVNEERSVARNFGADKAQGKYLIFLDSDDQMLDNYLLSVHGFMGKHQSEPEFIFTGYRIFNPDKTTLYEYGFDGFFNPAKLFFGNFLGCSSVVISKTLFKKYYFNTDPCLILFEDWELWLRVISENKLLCFPCKSIIMINHANRSVLNYSVMQIQDRILHFKSHVLQTSNAVKESAIYRRSFLTGIYSYASLHIAMTKKSRSMAIKYLVLAILSNPLFIFKRRFPGIIKQLI